IFLVARIVQPSESQVAALPLWARPFIAGDALAFYLYKLFVPMRLAMDYGRRPGVVLARGWIYAAWLGPWIICLGALRCRRRAPWLLAGFGIFVTALLPVLGLIPFNFQAYSTVANRYAYVAMLGPALALGGSLARTRHRAACGLAVAVVLLYAA